jgi:hypothetical protein
MPSTLIANGLSAPRAHNERTPLLFEIPPEPLAGAEADAVEEALQASDPDEEDADFGKPLPKTQIFLLCYTACVAPIAFFSIFPYINFMIERVGGVDKYESLM